MDRHDPSGRESWESPVALQELFSAQTRTIVPRPQGLQACDDVAMDLFALEALVPRSRVPRLQHSDPYTLQWFLDIEAIRYGKQGRWIPKLMEFSKHGGEVLLGLGKGLGTDWLQYARHDANVMVCSNSHSQLELVRSNFQLRGLDGQFVFAHPNRLPLTSSSVDVVSLSNLHMGVGNASAVIAEVYRVLKPGGKVLVVTSALYDVDFWFDTMFFLYRWIRRRKVRDHDPRHTGGQLRALFNRFCEHHIYKRQLRRSDVPHLWRCVPVSLLARIMGRVLVLKAFKPVVCSDEPSQLCLQLIEPLQ